MRAIGCVVIFVFFNGATAMSAAQTKDVKVAVKFDQTFYRMEFLKDSFSYSEGAINYRAKVAECNRSVVAKIPDEYLALYKNNLKTVQTANSEFDVEVVDGNGKSFGVARGSKFGTWLRDLPKTMMYFNAEVKASCKR